MEKNWYSYKTKDGVTMFYYNSDSGEHRWANGFEPLQCAKVRPEEVPLLEMCKNGHKMPKRKEKIYKSIGTETEEYFLVKNTASKSVRDIGVSAVRRNDFSSVDVNDDDGEDEDDGRVELVFQSFCASPSRDPFDTNEPFSETKEIVDEEYVDPSRGSLVGNLFAMELSSVLSSEPDKSKVDSSDTYRQTASSGEPENCLFKCQEPPTVSKDVQATHEGDEAVNVVKTEHENEDIPKGCYLGLTVGKEGRIYVKSEPDEGHLEQEIQIDETRIKEEVFQDDDDDGGDGGDIAKFSILDLLPDHPANEDSDSNNNEPISCEKCKKSFKKLSHLKRHMLIHTNRKPYSCKICSKSFREKNCLKKHIRTHTGEKPYHCAICDKAFSQSQNLNKHMNIHTGNKPHKCKVCGKAFSQHSHLARHKLIHTGEKPYRCTKCGKSYRTSSHLARHLKTSCKR